MRRGRLGNGPGSDVHLTPPEVWERLQVIYPVWFDPCPHPAETNGLDETWSDGPTYVNPPFSDLESWAYLAVEHSKRGLLPGMAGKCATVVLVPVRPSQPYFSALLKNCQAVAFWTGNKDRGGTLPRRVRFLRPDGTRQPGAPFDTAIFLLGWGLDKMRPKFRQAFSDVATVVRPLEVQ